MLLIGLGWVYFILPFVIFGLPLFIVFIFGYILGGNSTYKISDIFSAIGNLSSIGALILGYLIAFYWRPQFFSVKLIEKILKAKHDLFRINFNASSVLASVRVKIINNINFIKINRDEINSFCNELSNELKSCNPKKEEDLLCLSILESDLALFSPNEIKLMEAILRYRDYYYASCFSSFKLSIDVKGHHVEKLGEKDFLVSDCEFNVKFYLPDNVKVISIDDELRELGVKFENGEFSGKFSLEKLDEFYKEFSNKFNEVRDDLVKEFDKYITNQMKPKLLR
ncbi:hypothetical protein NMS75_003606 [Vibrio cholerae]|nr:hypothetical protein [Vibrio cholerae]